MSGTTLVVIDMQPEFTTYKKVVNPVLREIKLAKKRNDDIIFVEYKDSGYTYEGLLSSTKNHKKTHVITKNNDDGSREIIKCLREKKINPKRIRVVGVQRCCCVQDTVHGLSSHIPDKTIEVKWDATAGFFYPGKSLSSKRMFLEDISNPPNIKII